MDDGLDEDHHVGAVFANLRMRLKGKKVQTVVNVTQKVW